MNMANARENITIDPKKSLSQNMEANYAPFEKKVLANKKLNSEQMQAALNYRKQVIAYQFNSKTEKQRRAESAARGFESLEWENYVKRGGRRTQG